MTALEEPDMSGTYTAADYLRWNLDELVELIRGRIFKMSPVPTTNHQKISREWSGLFYLKFKNKKYQFFAAPFDVYLVIPGQDYKQAENIVEPDLCVICDADKIKKFGCVGAPDLVVEILSRSTSRRDLKDKFELYEEFGVKEYWIISPENRSVILNELQNGKYKTFRPLTEGDILQSKNFPELEVELNEIFRNVVDD